jgi:hypothetical protein
MCVFAWCTCLQKHMHEDSYGNMGVMRTSSDAGDGFTSDDQNLALQMQYQQLLGQGGAGMQLIAVPLQGGMQGLMQVGVGLCGWILAWAGLAALRSDICKSHLTVDRIASAKVQPLTLPTQLCCY